MESEETSERGRGMGLESSISKVSGSSKGIPLGKDFHYYNNFPEFKAPVQIIHQTSRQMLNRVGAASGLGLFCDDLNDMDSDAYDWLVNVNDDVVEKIDADIHDFNKAREEEEEGVKVGAMDEEGFEMVVGKKNRRGRERDGDGVRSPHGVELKVQVATKVKQKIPFHIASIPRPQDEYKIIVNNNNQPFEHVWLERTQDGIPIHPLEKFSPLDFVDTTGIQIEPVEPPPLECTPFKIVEEVRDLKELAAKLRNVNEFAVDLEHNQYRSFQGLTCLMQISTRNEDFVIDTLKLRIHVGPYLRELFKDPTKRKVMHGADRDVLWLQRDFGIYICNMFDTGQGSKVLNMERNSLEYLLNHFCGLQANKEYQNADWRLRPLPGEMQKYAREDTHYLLYIYDLMRKELLSLDADSECPGTSLLEVYKRSYSTCMLLYEKDLLTDSSFRSVYGVPGAGLSAEQLAVVSALCQWRDVVARSEDESTGFILPNRTLVEIAKEVPLTASKLRRFVRSKHPYVERNLGSVVSIIRDAIQNSSAFEAAAEELKLNLKGSENNVATAEDEVFPEADNIGINTPPKVQSGSGNSPEKIFSVNLHENGYVKSVIDGSEAAAPKPATDQAVASVEVLKKPSRAFGALLGNSSKIKLLPDKSEPEQIKLEQIISAVNLPFLPFVTMARPALPLEPSFQEEPVASKTTSKKEDIILLNSEEDLPNGVFEPVEENTDQTEHSGRTGVASKTTSKKEDIILLNSEEDLLNGVFEPVEEITGQTEHSGHTGVFGKDDGDDTMSLSDLSSSFQKCFQSINDSRKVERPEKSQGHEGGLLQLKPFDYEAARKQVTFGKASRREEGDDTRSRMGKGNNRKTSSAVADVGQCQQAQDLPQGKRRQAFPASGNRSATFRQFQT